MTKPFYETAEALEDACNAYFAMCDLGETVQQIRRGEAVDVHRQIPYTVVDLALFLGYSCRQSITDLRQNPKYSSTIVRALGRIEGQRVRKALSGEQEPRFAQFDLVNNFGYLSSKEQQTVKVEVALSDQELDNRLAMMEQRLLRACGQPGAGCIDVTPATPAALPVPAASVRRNNGE